MKADNGRNLTAQDLNGAIKLLKMKTVFFALAFMLVGTLTFANNVEVETIDDNVTIENVVSLNQISKTELLEESIFLELNGSSESVVSIKCWAAKQWVKHKLRQVSDEDEMIDEIGDAVYELCEIARDLGLF